MNVNENGVPEDLAAAMRANKDMERAYEDWRYFSKDSEDRALRQAFLNSGMVVPSAAAKHGAKMPHTYTLAMKIAEIAEQAAALIPWQGSSLVHDASLMNDVYRRDMTLTAMFAREVALIYVDDGRHMPYRWILLGLLQNFRNTLVPAVLDASDRHKRSTLL